jgi:hypothetical protein
VLTDQYGQLCWAVGTKVMNLPSTQGAKAQEVVHDALVKRRNSCKISLKEPWSRSRR